MEKSPPCIFFYQTQLIAQKQREISDFKAMFENVLPVAGAIFKPAQDAFEVVRKLTIFQIEFLDDTVADIQKQLFAFGAGLLQPLPGAVQIDHAVFDKLENGLAGNMFFDQLKM